MSLIENAENIRKKIKEQCILCGRDEKEIKIVAASKTVPAAVLNTLKDCGITSCGENRVQELLEKYGAVKTDWHFIGRLQTNKVKYLPGKISLLHSLDRIELAQEIERQYAKKDIVLNCLIEINIAGEQSKGGAPAASAQDFYGELKAYPHIKICGLMAVMPETDGHAANEEYYLQMRDIYGKIKQKAGGSFNILSVGMSGDYLTAIKYGSNMVRIGRALFGERVYTKKA